MVCYEISFFERLKCLNEGPRYEHQLPVQVFDMYTAHTAHTVCEHFMTFWNLCYFLIVSSYIFLAWFIAHLITQTKF